MPRRRHNSADVPGRIDNKLVAVRFTEAEWNHLLAAMRRLNFPVPVGPFCKTIVLRAIGYLPEADQSGIRAAV